MPVPVTGQLWPRSGTTVVIIEDCYPTDSVSTMLIDTPPVLVTASDVVPPISLFTDGVTSALIAEVSSTVSDPVPAASGGISESPSVVLV